MFWDDPAFMSSTLLHGTFALRMCILNDATEWNDVRETLEAVEKFGKEALLNGTSGPRFSPNPLT